MLSVRQLTLVSCTLGPIVAVRSEERLTGLVNVVCPNWPHQLLDSTCHCHRRRRGSAAVEISFTHNQKIDVVRTEGLKFRCRKLSHLNVVSTIASAYHFRTQRSVTAIHPSSTPQVLVSQAFKFEVSCDYSSF